MECEPAEAIAILAVYAAACVPAVVVFRRRRDPFDPRVFFPIVYAYLTTGPYLFKIFVSGEYHPGLKVDWLIPVLFSCASAILGFALGGTIALSATRSTMIGRTVWRRASLVNERSSSNLVRGMAILCATISVFAFGYFSFQLQSCDSGASGEGKAYVIAGADESTLRSYYFFAAATTAALTLAIIADAYASYRTFSAAIVALLTAEFAICTYSGERDFLLVGGVWCLANWRKLSRTQVLLFAAALLGWIGIVPVLRTAGLGIGSQIAAVDHLSTEDWLYSVTHFAPNVHVFTNVVDEVPAAEPHWKGYSLLAAVASIVPGDFELKETTPARWFRDIYDMQRVAGYAFAQDAEAYLNFGWIGPPIWFLSWGYLLGVAYRRAARPAAPIFDVFIWWYAVAISSFGVRSDTRGIIKMFVLGMVAAKLLCLFADFWSRCSAPSRRPGRLAKRHLRYHAASGRISPMHRPTIARRIP